MAEYTIGPVSCTATDPGTGLHEFSGRVVLTTTTDAANNATTINAWRFEIYITRQAYISHYSYQHNNRCTVVINGQTLVSSSNIMAVAMNGRYESGDPGPLVLCSGGNITVPHNSDGTKSLAVSANYTQTGSGNYIGTIAPSGTIALETIARADVISTAPALTLAGSGTTNHTVSWTNSGSFYHSIEYKYGNTTLTTQNVSGTSATSYTYAVPASWASNVTNAKTMTVTAVLHSYSDSGRTNELGSNSKTFVVTFADSFAPTFGTATLVQNDRLSSTVVAGRTYTKVTVTPSYKNSATYKSGWAVYMDGTKELGSRKTGNPADGITLDTIPAFTATSKSLTIKCSVTDSRGFTATVTSSAVAVYGWAAPSITSLSAVRCNSSGTADLSGSNFKVTVAYSIRALNNANAKTIQVNYRWNSQSTFTTAATATPTNYSGTLTLGPYGLSNAQDDKLIVRVEVYDSLSSSNHTTADTTVLPASVFMDIMTNGDKKVGLAVGMVNSKQNTVQLGWPLEMEGNGKAVLDPIAGLSFFDSSGLLKALYPPVFGGTIAVGYNIQMQSLEDDNCALDIAFAADGEGGDYLITITQNPDGTNTLQIIENT